jgi:hypothetical protein
MSAAIALFLAFGALPIHAASVSIISYDPYNGQTECAKRCLWHAGALDDLIAAIGCSTPWTNECFCQPDLASSASEFLSGCVANQCTTPKTGQAVTRAVSVYNNYCSANGFSIPTAASIKSYSAYASQPDCVQQCLWHVGALDDLMPAIGCDAPWDNSCLCNSALATSAAAFLSTCVASRCSTGTDAPPVTDAISVHVAYCSSAGLPIPVAVAATTTTRATSTGSDSASSPPATVTPEGTTVQEPGAFPTHPIQKSVGTTNGKVFSGTGGADLHRDRALRWSHCRYCNRCCRWSGGGYRCRCLHHV